MAKKSVASLQKGVGKQHTKVIKMVKSPKSGAYTFKEEIELTFTRNIIKVPHV